MQDQRGLSAERKCWPAAARLSSGGQTVEEPLESRAERSVLMIRVECVKVCMVICLYVSMV